MTNYYIRSLLHNVLVVITISTSFLLCRGFQTGPYHPLKSVTPKATITRRIPCLLHLSSSDNDAYNDAVTLNKQRTSLKQFLTQRSIQSFMFLSTQLRDPHTSDWIERFIGSPRLLEYHGTGAFNLTRWGEWDSVFLEMMEQPVNKIIIEARKRGGRGAMGGSKNNPYLKEKFVEYEVTIDPKSLSSRIMAVREQIANELMKDLSMVIVYNEGVLDRYNAKLNESRNPPTNNCYTDQNAMLMLENSIALDTTMSSPFRKGNFDLLLLLTLHEAIHRTLRSYAAGGKENAISLEWLREFYSGTVGKYFDGSGRYGRSDEFMTRLLEATPSMINDGGSMLLVDPARITEDIIAERSKVALEWKLVAMDVPADHSGLRKALLSKTWVDDLERAAEKVPEEDGAGGFE